MSFSGALRAEWRKYPTWISLGLICCMPLGVVLLKTLGFLIRKKSLVADQRFNWELFLQAGHLEWTQMLVPLTLATWTVYVCWIENDGNTWKLLCIQPRGRAVTFLAKLGVVWIWLISFLAINILVYFTAGSLLFPDQPAPLKQLILFNAIGLVLLGPILNVQFWLATRFANPMMPLAICLAGNVIAILGSGKWLFFLPWAYAKYVGTISLADHATLAGSAVALNLAVVVLGYFEFARKDIP